MRKLFSLIYLCGTLFSAEPSLFEIRENILNVDDETLIKHAKRFNLVAIPRDAAELEKLIAKVDPEYARFASTNERIELGKKLFFDPRLSRSGLISCNTCHNLALGGADNVAISTGHKWQPNPSHINTPTVLNAVFNARQFWNGRANHLKEQAMGPIQADVEMAETSENVVSKLASIPQYVKDFRSAFDSEITFELVASAIGIFERTLITPSRYDDFLNGDANALDAEQKRGLALFINKGCVLCHNGINLGGGFRGFGIERYQYANYGDFFDAEDARIKVPTLRNVERTAPYFHNGSVWTLGEAVESMGRIQLAIELESEEIEAIISFLKSLTGELKSIEYPRLPPSSDTTLRPKLDL